MGLAETAILAVELKLQGGGAFSAGIKGAEGSLAGLNATTKATGGHLSGLVGAAGAAERGALSLGGAFGHAGGQLKGLITGPLGIIGLGAGLLSLGGIFKESVGHAQELGLAVEKLTALTGQSAAVVSTEIAIFEKYGVGIDKASTLIGFAEKTLGKLTATSSTAAKEQAQLTAAQQAVTKATEKLDVAHLKLIETEHKRNASASALATAQFHVTDASTGLAAAQAKLTAIQQASGDPLTKASKLQEKYGIVLTDSQGKAVSFETELRNLADFYIGTASASDKALVASTLFGRGYTALIPLLALGSRGIIEAEQAAKDLGLTLTDQNASELRDYQTAIRGTGEAISGLQLQIGLALIPEVGKLAKGLTSFLANGGTAQIVQFFKDGAKFADEFGTVVHDTVLPVFGAIADAWGKVPGDLKKILIGGFIANKASKFLFDFGIKDAAGGLKGIIEGLLGRVPGVKNVVGALDPGMRVFVTNFPLGFGGGLGGGLPGAAAAAGAGGAATAIIGGAGLVVLPFILKGDTPTGADRPGNADQQRIFDLERRIDTLRYRNPADMYGTSGKTNSQILAEATAELAALKGSSSDLSEAAAQMRNAARGYDDTASNLAESASQLRNASKGLSDTADKAPVDRGAMYAAFRKAFGLSPVGDPSKDTSLTGRLGYLNAGRDSTKIVALSGALTSHVESPSGNPLYTSSKNIEKLIAADTVAMQHLLSRGNTKDAAVIAADIARMKAVLAHSIEVAAQKTAQASALAGQATASAIMRKDLTANVNVANATYINGRLIQAGLSRYTTLVGSSFGGGRDPYA